MKAQSHLSSPLFANDEFKLITQFEDTQEHLLVCSKLASNFTSNKMTENGSTFDYSDIFKDCEKSLKLIVVMFTDLLEARQNIIELPGTLVQKKFAVVL